MKPKQERKSRPWSGHMLAAAGLVLLAMGGVLYGMLHRARAARERLDGAIEAYEEMKDLKRRVLELSAKVSRQDQKEINPDDIPVYLESKRTQAGLPNAVLTSEQANPVAGWREWPTRLVLSSKSKDSAASRAAFVDFLTAVERERPYLKSRTLDLTFENGPDLKNAAVVVSYYKRE